MQEVSLDKLADGFDKVLREFPDKRRELLSEIGQEVLSAVRGDIGGAGKVQSWQEEHLGSYGGYAAVRPVAKTWQETRGGKRYAVGAVTNAIESGHNVRQPGATARRKSRAVMSFVPGKHFYSDAGEAAEEIARRRAGEFTEAMKKLLEE